MQTHIKRVFRDLERDTERISAGLRMIVVLALGVLLLTTDSPDPHNLLTVALGAYFGVAVLAVGFAYFRFFRPWLPWLFVTLDVAVLWLIIAVPGRSMGMAPVAILALPAAALVFVILAHAAMRYRPALVVYATSLFIGVWIVTLVFFGNEDMRMPAHRGQMWHAMATDWSWHATVQEVTRALMIVLVALILVVTVTRTKHRVLQSIIAAHQAANLSRFMPENLLDKLSQEDLESIRKSKRQNAAVMFTDIRGFSTLSENTDPAELGQFLGEFRSRLSGPVSTHHGMIDKFIGDAIMAVFGVPQPGDNDGRNALNAALGIIAELDQWNKERRAQNQDFVSVGIGVHFGPVVAGALGDASRLEYTVIGDTVNVAERLEKLTRTFDAPLVVSHDLLIAAREDTGSSHWDMLPVHALKGRSGEIVAYRWTKTTEEVVPGGTDQA
jgi:adenylate cyclase